MMSLVSVVILRNISGRILMQKNDIVMQNLKLVQKQMPIE